MVLTVFILLSVLGATTQEDSNIIEDCVRKNQVQIFPEFNSACCEMNQMLIKTKEGQYRYGAIEHTQGIHNENMKYLNYIINISSIIQYKHYVEI